MRASFGPPESITQMVSRLVHVFLHSSCQSVIRHVGGISSPQIYSSVHSTQHPTWQMDRFSRFLHISWQTVHILYSGCPFPPKTPLPWGDLCPHVITWALPSPQPKQCVDQLAIFAQMTTMAAPSLPQNWPFPWGMLTPTNTWFREST